MIEYDYLIRRNEGDREVTYAPKGIPKKLDNLVLIEGPNSSGKSTLLNIIALSLHGLRNKRMNSSLVDKLKSLSSSDHQSLTFKVSISNSDNSLSLIAKKDSEESPEIELFEKVGASKPIRLNDESFEKRYNLIYDIPDNPTSRLHNLILDIKDLQVRYGHSVSILKESIRRIISDIKEARDPDRIKTLEMELHDIDSQRNQIKQKAEQFKQHLELIEDYTYQRFYTEYKDKCELFQSELKTLERQTKKVLTKASKEKVSQNTTVDMANKTMSSLQQAFVEAIISLKTIVKDKHLLKIWEKIDLRQALHDLEFDDRLDEFIPQFQRDLREQGYALNKNDSAKEAEMINELLDVLERYKNLKGDLPGLGKPITDLIGELRKASEKYASTIVIKNNIKEAEDDLEKFIILKDQLTKSLFPQLKKIKAVGKSEPDSEEDVRGAEIREISEKLKKSQDAFEYYDSRYSRKGKPSEKEILARGGKELRPYAMFREEQLRQHITEWTSKAGETEGQKNRLESTFVSISNELERLKSKKPHQYQNQLEALSIMFDKANALDAKLRNNFSIYIEEIIRKQIPLKVKDEQKKYNEAVFDYLGMRLGKFFHIASEYVASKVDLSKGVIHTKQGKIIHLTDMGTGHGQSAYLRGLLNTSDKRVIIAMFDEVAMMDTNALEPIYDKFRELYKNGKLLLGVVVQRGDKVNIVSKLN